MVDETVFVGGIGSKLVLCTDLIHLGVLSPHSAIAYQPGWANQQRCQHFARLGGSEKVVTPVLVDAHPLSRQNNGA